MEIVLYIVIPILTFFGITSMPTRLITMMFAGRPSVLTIFPIVAAYFIWTCIDIIHSNLTNAPIPIALFLICWLVKLIEDQVVKKASWQININMAEAWVIFIWAILAMFGDFRGWF